MSYGTTRRLPKIAFKPGDLIHLDRWLGRDARGKDRTEEVAVEVMEVRHEPYWQLESDGGHTAEPAIYQVRVVATGEEFPADERGLNRYPRPVKVAPLGVNPAAKAKAKGGRS